MVEIVTTNGIRILALVIGCLIYSASVSYHLARCCPLINVQIEGLDDSAETRYFSLLADGSAWLDTGDRVVRSEIIMAH